MKLSNTRTWSTPMVIGAGLFVASSGTLMFWGLAKPLEEAHTWIGLAFATGIFLHVLNHWRSFKNYFTKPLGRAVIAALLVATLVVIFWPADEETTARADRGAVYAAVQNASVSQLSDLIGQDSESMVSLLVDQGFAQAAADKSLADIASESGKTGDAALAVIFPSN